MSLLIDESKLPKSLTAQDAVEAAYPAEMAEVAGRLLLGLPTLIECDKELAPYLFMNLRGRLREKNVRCLYLDGRPREGDPPPAGGMPLGLMGTMIAQLRDAVRGAVERRVVVLPHLDLLTTSSGGLTSEAREVIPLLYENPELVWLGFKDPSFPLPKVIENLFPHRVSILGIGRDRLPKLVTQKEAKKFGRGFNPWQLYKYVSGVNAVRLRRLLSTLEGEDYPADPKGAYRHLRQGTLTGSLEIPNVDLDADIGGYKKVKKRLREEILDVLKRRDEASDKADAERLEELIPRGMIFWGPPGTGKTYFAKAVATAIGAAVTIVSGPELKSKWVGESLPYEEEVFVVVNGVARRMPIGELVEMHTADDDIRAWTYTDSGEARLAPVTGLLKHAAPDYIDVITTETGREVRVTGGHSLFVEKGGQLAEIFADEIETGVTRIAVPARLDLPGEAIEFNLLELLAGRDDVRVAGHEPALAEAFARVGGEAAEGAGAAVARMTHARPAPLTLGALQRVAGAAGVPLDPGALRLYCWHRNKSMPASMPLTEDLAEFLGVWTADGCYASTGVRLAAHEREAGHLTALCNRLFGHVTVARKRGDGARGVDLVINSTLLRHVMRDGLGLADGSGRKRVPAAIFLAPRPVVAAFLRGYFSGDGTFSGKYVEATTVSRGLAGDVLTLLQYFGIAARARAKAERSGSTSHRVRFLWTEYLRRFVDEIGFNDPAKNDAIRAYLATRRLKRDLQTPARHTRNDVLWDRVVSVRRERYSRPHVYDLSVAGTERFVAGYGNVIVHNSEENLRQIFHKARQSAPSVIVFDELDSFATARGTYTGSGVDHSMVNQLLTEMDGFHKDELVFIVGTTNFVESLDPALLRPGRFEFHLHIPYPEAEDRRAILEYYNKRMRLKMTDAAVDYAVRRTGDFVVGAAAGTRYSGDHIQALARSLARLRLRRNDGGETTPELVESAMTEWLDRPVMTKQEELVLATHEAGHAVVSLFCEHAPPIDRITIASEMQWSFGYVKFADPAHRYVRTVGFYLDQICVALGAREAERLLLDDISMGATQDLQSATSIARELVEVQGLGGGALGVVQYLDPHTRHPAQRRDHLAAETLAALDARVAEVVEKERLRAEKLVREHRAIIELLRDTLLDKKTLDTKALHALIPAPARRANEAKEPHPDSVAAAG